MLRAKFVCSLVSPAGNDGERVVLHSVESDENAALQLTGGALSMVISEPEAKGKFSLGKRYFIDITEV